MPKSQSLEELIEETLYKQRDLIIDGHTLPPSFLPKAMKKAHNNALSLAEEAVEEVSNTGYLRDTSSNNIAGTIHQYDPEQAKSAIKKLKV